MKVSHPLEICGLPDMSSRNQTWVLGESSSMRSQSLSHCFSHCLHFSVNENDNFRRIYDFPECHFKVSNSILDFKFLAHLIWPYTILFYMVNFVPLYLPFLKACLFVWEQYA